MLLYIYIHRPEDITALAWVDCGVLTVAAGNQIRCYLKWLTEQDNVTTKRKFITFYIIR
jgi:hypothetical protein